MKKIFQNTLALLSKKERRRFYWFALFDIIISIVDIISLALLVLIISFYTEPAATDRSYKLFEYFQNTHSSIPVLGFAAFFSVKNFLGYLLQKSQYDFAYSIAARISEKKFLQYLNAGYENYTAIDSSVHIRKISHHPVEFAQYVLTGIQQIITQSVLIAAALAAVCWFDPALFALLFLLLLPPILGIAFFIRQRTRSARKKIKAGGEKMLQHLKEGLSGYVESNVYDKHAFFTRRYSSWQQQLNEQLSRLQGIQGLSGRLLEVFALLGLVIIIAAADWLGAGSGFSILSVGAFMAAAYKTIPGIVKILNSSGQVHTYSFALNELLKDDQKESNTGAQASAIRSVEFRNISFGYDSNQLLNNLSWSIGKGDFAGVSAVSGKGKTTMLNLLLSFLQPGKGEILINGSASGAADRQKYRQRIAYVKQQAFLIHDSLQKNIVLDDEVDPGKLNQVIEAAGLQELVQSDEAGLDQLITEEGRNISGGQRQRIAIARALYKDADLLIFDEPFNELDKVSEKKLLAKLAALAQNGKMILLITHNMESFSFCNKLISLDEK